MAVWLREILIALYPRPLEQKVSTEISGGTLWRQRLKLLGTLTSLDLRDSVRSDDLAEILRSPERFLPCGPFICIAT